jgi:hypothetical protein
MRVWKIADENLAMELQAYVNKARLYPAGVAWTIADKGKPWTEYYSHTSAILRTMRETQRKKVGKP